MSWTTVTEHFSILGFYPGPRGPVSKAMKVSPHLQKNEIYQKLKLNP